MSHVPLRQTALPLLAILAWLAAAQVARAGDAISTDRPDFVESSDVVGRGRVQIETGFSEERDRQGGVKTRTRTTPTLLRIGVGDTVELRVETDGFARRSTQDPALPGTLRERGFSDTALGIKWHTQDGDQTRGSPGTAWLAHLDLASGSRAFRGQGVRPSLRWVAEWELPRDFSVGLMPGVMLDRNDEGKRFAAGILAVTLAKGWSPAWHTFIELAGHRLASRANGGSVVTFDTGVAHLVSPSVQVDLSAARGLTSAAPRFQWGLGLSARF